LVSEEDFVKKRQEFWDTRVEGDKNVWNTIRAAIDEPDVEQAKSFIEAAGLTLAQGNLLQVLDANSTPYIVPVFVIHDPISYKTEKAEKVPKNFAHKTLKLIIRPMGSNI
jgi:hypothetical protein